MGKKNKNKSAASAAAAAPAGKPVAAAPKKQEAKPAAAVSAPKKQEPKKQAPAAAAAPKPKEKPAAKAAAAAAAPPAKKAKVEPKKAEPETKAVSASEGEEDSDDEEGIDMDSEAFDAMNEIAGKLADVKEAEQKEEVEARLKIVAKYIPKRTELYEERKKAIAKIEKFWAFVISSSDDLESMIDEEHDLGLLSALEDISVKHNERNPASYQLMFTFAANEFLANNSITVDVTASSEQDASVKVTPIQWKKGKNFTAASTNEPANKKKRAAEYDGFFHFFANPDEAGADDFFNVIAHELYPDAWEMYLLARGLIGGDSDMDSDEDGEGFQFDEMDSDEEMEEADE